MRKIFIFFIFSLLCSISVNAQVSRANSKKSVLYRASYQRMAAGLNHTLEIRDGTLWTWGSNFSGQLGDGTTVDKNSPVQIGTDKTWVSVTGSDHSLGLKSDGTLWAWGYNNAGQLGDGTTINKNSPVQIGSDTKWICISAGSTHTLGLKSDGTLWAWGKNLNGQLGDGTTVDKNSPVQIGVDNKWVSISAGYFHSIGLKSDGTLWTWGKNLNGQLGDGTTVDKNIPIQIGADNKWTNIIAGGNHSLGLKSDGTLWAWGNNGYGQLGDATNTQRTSPVQVGTDNKWVNIKAGVYHTLGIKSDGTLWAWGFNGWGQLGEGSTVDKNSPVQIGADIKWTSIGAGFNHTLGSKSDGTLWAWGSNTYGQLGDGTTVSKITPSSSSTVLNIWLSIATGQHHTIGIKTDGTLWAWGYNNAGQLGDGTNTDKNIPVQIGSDNKWVSITTGYSHSLGIKSDGTLWAWGNNFTGQLGDGTTTNKNIPTQIGVDNKWASITAGQSHSLALKSDGTLWAWGYNGYGQLGDGTTVNKSSPIQIGADNKWVCLTSGEHHTHGIKSDGTLWAWGWNSSKQLGDGTTVNKSSPVQIGADTKWTSITAGSFHGLGIKSDGTLWAWGTNGSGQLGDGTNVDKSSPVQIGIDNKWICITAGRFHTLAVKSEGTLWSWGYNLFGELGDGTTVNNNSPAQIGAETKWIYITAGFEYSVGLKSDRRKFCATGQNTYGQLGDGTTTNSLTFLCNTNCSVAVSISSSTNVACNGGNNGGATATVTGGNSPFTYLWNPSGQTTSAAVALPADNYTVTIADLDDCPASATVAITEPAALTSTATVTDVSCFGTNTGSVTVSVNGGTIPYTYNWNTGSTTSSVNNLIAGNYSVVITDANGCTDTVYATVNEPAQLSVSDVITNLICNGGNNGSIDITTSGGTNPYTYSWTGGITTEDISGLTANIYSLIVTDVNGCSVANTYTVSQPPAVAAGFSITDVSCFGGSDGSLTVTVTAGVSPYTYQWDPSAGSQTTQTITGLISGTYSVTVTDADGCSGIFSALIKEPTLLTSTITPVDVKCNGGSNGGVDLTVSGGLGSYTYLWSNTATTQDITNIASGNYSVLITDGNGCASTNSVVVNQPAVLSPLISQTNVTCNGACDGTATVNVTGGTPPYVYQWLTAPNQSTQTATGLCPGNYNVVVSDNNNCNTVPNVIISQPLTLTLSVSVVDATCNASNGSATANVSGGTTPYTYNWSNGNSNQTANNLVAGNYSVTVTDSSGCTASGFGVVDTIALSVPICIVTVDSTSTKNVIWWDKPANAPIDSFRIYRDIASVYTYVGAVSYDSLSTFTDSTPGVDPNFTYYRYKISALDTCGVESDTSAFHQTIHLQVSYAAPQGYNLSWNDYLGIPVSQYRLLRDTSGTGNWYAFDSTSFGIVTRTDPVQWDTVYYMIEIDHPTGCTASVKNPIPMGSNLNSSRSNVYKISDTTLTGINELNNNHIAIYPNPSTGFFTVEIINPEDKTEVIVSNILGSEVYREGLSGKVKKYDFDLSFVSKGIYHFQLKTKNRIVDKKIIIQ